MAVTVAKILAVQRAVSAEFIAQDPTTIVLIPTVRTKQPSGSWAETDGPPRPAQTFKMIPIDFTAHGASLTVTQDGVERIISYVIMGEWNSVMAAGDHWTGADGRKYRIIAVMDGHGYEQKATVEAHGA